MHYASHLVIIHRFKQPKIITDVLLLFLTDFDFIWFIIIFDEPFFISIISSIYIHDIVQTIFMLP